MDSRKVAITFGGVLRNFRRKRALSQEKLAFECELDRSYISLLELGRQVPSLTTVLALSHGLQIPVGLLVSLVEERLKGILDK